MSSNVLAAKDVNMSMTSDNTTNTNNNHNTSSDTIIKPDTMSMEYHRQVLQSKMEKEEYVISPLSLSQTHALSRNPHVAQLLTSLIASSKTYVSPSDNIMSPCTAKLSAFRSKQVGKYVEFPQLLRSPHTQDLLTNVYSTESSPSPSSPRRRLRNSRAMAGFYLAASRPRRSSPRRLVVLHRLKN